MEPSKKLKFKSRSSAYNRLCANSPGSRAYCYAELAVSSLAVALTIARRVYGGMTRVSWPGWLD